jgi:hypothetical protein
MSVAIVTGAASGMGRACAVRFVAEGWQVAALDRVEALAWKRSSSRTPARRLLGTMLGCGWRASADDSFAMAKQASEEAAFARSCLLPCRRLATLRTDDRIDAGAAARGFRVVVSAGRRGDDAASTSAPSAPRRG